MLHFYRLYLNCTFNIAKTIQFYEFICWNNFTSVRPDRVCLYYFHDIFWKQDPSSSSVRLQCIINEFWCDIICNATVYFWTI